MSLFLMLNPKIFQHAGYVAGALSGKIKNPIVKEADRLVRRKIKENTSYTEELEHEMSKMVGITSKLASDLSKLSRAELIKMRDEIANKILLMEEEEYMMLLMLLGD